MSAYQLKDGRWVVNYRDPDDPTRWKREYFGRGLEAERKARKRNEELGYGRGSGRPPRVRSVTFGRVALEYFEAKRGINQPSTLAALYLKLNSIILPELGETPVSLLTHRRADQYVQKRLKTPVYLWYGPKDENGRLTQRRPKTDSEGKTVTVSRSTVRRELADIIAIVNWGVKRGYVSHNPLAGYEKPVARPATIRPVTVEEAGRILAESPGHLTRALTIAYYTGLRPGPVELFSLSWDKVDWEEAVFTVVSAAKGGPKTRQVPIGEDFMGLLRGWYAADRGEEVYIIRYNGLPVRSVKKTYGNAKRRAGITRRLPPYSFRHAFVTALLARSGNLKAVSEMAGHSRTSTTTMIYQHTDLDQARDAISRLPPLPS